MPRFTDRHGNDQRLLNVHEAAELLGVAPSAVRSTLRRAGIAELRGYPSAQVEGFARRRAERAMIARVVDRHKAAVQRLAEARAAGQPAEEEG